MVSWKGNKYCLDISNEVEDALNYESEEEVVGDESPKNPPNTVKAAEPADERRAKRILLSALEAATRPKNRTSALQAMHEQLQKRYLPQFVETHRQEFFDPLKAVLDESSTSETQLNMAVRLIPLVTVQCKDKYFMKPLQPLLFEALHKNLIPLQVRSSICQTITILELFWAESVIDVNKAMSAFSGIFSGSYVFEGINRPVLSENETEFHIAALEAWTFLTAMIPTFNSSYCRIFFGQVTSLLRHTNYYMRTQCAKTIAVVHECGHEYDRKYILNNLPQILREINDIKMGYTVHGLPQETKTKAAVLSYFKFLTSPQREIRLENDMLKLTTWGLNVQYEMLCNLFGEANLPKHLASNRFLLKRLKYANAENRNRSNRPELLLIQNALRDRKPPKEEKGSQEPDSSKLEKMLEDARSEVSKVRISSLSWLCDEIQKRFVPNDVLTARSRDLGDVIIRALRRDNEVDQVLAIRLMIMATFQLGSDWATSTMTTLIQSMARDAKTPLTTVSWLFTAQAFFCLTGNEKTNQVHIIMQSLHQAFTAKPKQTNNSQVEEETRMRVSALEAWALLMTSLAPETVVKNRKLSPISDLIELLECPQVELRLASGEVILMLLEHGRTHAPEFLEKSIPDLKRIATTLSTDQARFVSKTNRRTEHAKFRTILKYLEDGTVPEQTLRFAEEFHQLGTWSACFRHRKICEIVGPGLTTHLVSNSRLRDIIPIGPTPHNNSPLKPSQQHKLGNANKKKPKTLARKEDRFHRAQQLEI